MSTVASDNVVRCEVSLRRGVREERERKRGKPCWCQWWSIVSKWIYGLKAGTDAGIDWIWKFRKVGVDCKLKQEPDLGGHCSGNKLSPLIQYYKWFCFKTTSNKLETFLFSDHKRSKNVCDIVSCIFFIKPFLIIISWSIIFFIFLTKLDMIA